MGDPQIILGDEPTGALSLTASNEIRVLLADIHRNGTTILPVTHDVKVAAESERVLFIFDGRIAGECRSGVSDGALDVLKAREEGLTTWLAERKF